MQRDFKMQNTFLVLCAVAMTWLSSVAASIVYPEFEVGMCREVDCFNRSSKAIEKRQELYHLADPEYVDLFTEIYNTHVAAAKQDCHKGDYRIPRIVHQIWLGSPVPEKYFKWMESWVGYYGWEYKLWTEEDVKGMKLQNRVLYEASRNYGEKADILRLEILYQYGGVYADVDYECTNHEIIDELHQSFDFYIGFEPLEHGYVKRFNMFKLCNAIIGAKQYHPLIKDLIVNLRANYYAYRDRCGPVERTGPSYITRIICEYEKRHTHNLRNIYLPCTFFYPYSEADLNFFQENPQLGVPLFNETVGIHYWSGSWLPQRQNSSSIK